MRIPRAITAAQSLEIAPIAILWVTFDGTLAYANPVAQELLEWKSEELLGNSISMIAFDWAIEEWAQKWWPNSPNASPELECIALKTKAGQPLSRTCAIRRVHVAGQEVACLYLLQDPTENPSPTNPRQANTLPGWYASLHLGAVLLDSTLRIQDANPAILALLSADLNFLRGRSIEEAIPTLPSEKPRWRELVDRINPSWEFQTTNSQGQPLTLRASAQSLHPNSGSQTILQIEDRSESVQLKKLLEQREVSFSNIVTNTPGMVYTFVMTPEGNASFPYASSGTRDIWEVDPTEIHSDATPVVRLIHPEDLGAFQSSVMKSAMELSPWDFEGRILTPSGKLKWFHAASRPVLLDNGNIEWGGLLMDITRQKQIEEELKSAKQAAESAAKSKSDFLANMSHEIRTPMNGIIGMSELLIKLTQEPKQKHYVETIRSSAESLLTILNDILDISKMEAGKLTLNSAPFDFQRVLDDVALLLAPTAFGKGLEMVVRYDPSAAVHVVGDGVRIRQVLTNLIGNAIKFTARGHVLVNVDQLGVHEGSANLRVSVSDTGIGISDEAMSRLFQKFEQAETSTARKFGGTGLGLAISRQLVELMGGAISVESELGKGSCFFFTLTLPLCKATHSHEDHADLSAMRILSVDDHPVNNEMMGEVLDSWGVRHHAETDSGKEALRLLREAKQNGNPYDVGILDLHMPEMDGLHLVRAIRSEPEISNVELILFTSSTLSPEQQREMAEMGVTIHLTKPLRQFELKQALSLIGTKSAPNLQSGSQPESPAAAELLPAATPSIPLQILLAEDNEVNAEIASSMLADLGCQVHLAENGVQALEAVPRGAFDLIFMDCQMPVMDGFTATTQIRQLSLPRRPFIIAMTAYAMAGDREKCIAAGMDDYLSKPVTFAAIQGMVQKYAELIEIQRKPSPPESQPGTLGDGTPDSPSVFEKASAPSFVLSAAMAVTGGRPEVLRKALGIWWNKVPVWLEKMKGCVEMGDAVGLRHTAHTLKGAALNLGALAVGEYAQRLETCGDPKDSETGCLFECLVMEIERLRVAIHTDFPEMPQA